jgi:hypothetical protein
MKNIKKFIILRKKRRRRKQWLREVYKTFKDNITNLPRIQKAVCLWVPEVAEAPVPVVPEAWEVSLKTPVLP